MNSFKLLLIQCIFIYTICNPKFIHTTSDISLKEQTSEFDHLFKKKELVVVKGLNITRYVGFWYQIAAYPSFFEPKNAINVRANYTLNPDGTTVHVVNEEIVLGFKFNIEGTLYKADPSNDEAKFKVKFKVVPIPGNYWVLYVDDDYQYALVGEPTRTSLFILSKKIEIDDNVYNYIVQIAEEEGYDASKLLKTKQTVDPPSLSNKNVVIR